MVQFIEFQENAGDGWRGWVRRGYPNKFYSLFVSSDPMVAYPEVKVQVRDLVRVVGNVAPFAPRGSIFGEIRFIETQGVNRHRRPVPGAPSSGTPRESQAKFWGGSVW